MRFRVMTLCLLVAVSAAGQAPLDQKRREKLARDLQDLEMLSAKLRQVVPDSFDLAEEKRKVAAAAERAEVKVEVREVATETVAPFTMHRLEVSGEAEYWAAHFLVQSLRLRRPLDSVHFEAKDAPQVRFVARFAIPEWGGEWDEPAAGSGSTDLQAAVDRRRATVDRLIAAMDRMEVYDSADALAVFTRAIEGQRVALTSATVAGEISMEGLTLGAGAKRTVEQALVEAKLQPARVEWSAKGRCRAFTIVAGAERVERELVAGGDVFDAASATVCSNDDGPLRKLVVRRAGSTDPALFMKLRDVPASELFSILNDLFDEHFLVDPDVAGRFDLDVHADAGIEDLFTALSREGIFVGARPLRRVSTRPVAAKPLPGGGEPLTLSFRDASLSQVLCLLKDVTGRPLTMSPQQQSQVRLFAFSVPAETVVAALTPPAAAGATDPCTIPTRSRPRLTRTTVESLADLSFEDVRVAGVVVSGNVKAYFEIPGAGMQGLERGQAFRDGTLSAIASDAVTFTTAGRNVVVPFP